MVFSSRNRGGYHFSNRAHKVPRTFSPPSAQTGTAPTILLYMPTTARNGPVPGSLQTSGRRCLGTTYTGHFPVQFMRTSPNDSRTYKFRQPNYRGSLNAGPRPRSIPTRRDLLYDFPTECPSTGGQPLSPSPPMHDLFRLRSPGSRMPSSSTVSNLPIAISHRRIMRVQQAQSHNDHTSSPDRAQEHVLSTGRA